MWKVPMWMGNVSIGGGELEVLNFKDLQVSNEMFYVGGYAK